MPILSDSEVEAAARVVGNLQGWSGAAVRLAADVGIDVRDILRFQSLGSRCEAERESSGWSIKEAAARVGCAQYRLRAIESSSLGEVDPTALERYLSLLGLRPFFEEWASANPELASKVRVPQREGRGRTRGPGAGRKKRAYRIAIQLLEVEPPIWRRIEVPATYSFWDLHVAIQDAMGWLDYHLHLFEPGPVRPRAGPQIGIPDPDAFEGDPILEAGWEVSLDRWLRNPGDTLRYVYDFGDDWRHEVVLEDVVEVPPRARLPRCLDGAGACPPEDCGGAGGYQELLRILADPRDPEYGSMLEWLGGGHDPSVFDPRRVRFDDPRRRWELAFAGRNA